MSYVHSNGVIDFDEASITRSAQPLVGLKQNRSIQDEKLVEAIFGTAGGLENLAGCDEDGTHLIIDARPVTNAMAQTAMGAGTESSDNYPFSKISYLGIENIHVVRDSLTKLYDGKFNANLSMRII